jgi:putative ABC transport system substrate-binding protein
MRKKLIYLGALCPVLLALCNSAEAQQLAKVARIGFLSTASLSALSPRLEAFRQGLRELGYVEGKNLAMEYRSADGKIARLPELAVELVDLKVDCIFAAGGNPTRAAKQATSSIPIVMGNPGDPVGAGYVASLARPGANVTGLSSFSTELAGKRLELLKETAPKSSRVAIMWNSAGPSSTLSFKEIEDAARLVKVQLISLDVQSLQQLENAFDSLAKSRADAFMAGGSGLFGTHRKRIVESAAKHRLPAMYTEQEYVLVGGLMTYATSIPDLYRRAATYVDKILKGARPADLPVEQPTKFEFVINLKAAKQIGLTIPPQVLARADRVIR